MTGIFPGNRPAGDYALLDRVHSQCTISPINGEINPCADSYKHSQLEFSFSSAGGLFAIEKGWHLLDVIGRGEVASNLGHIAEKLSKFMISHESIGWQILPWALMVVPTYFLALLQWPALWPFRSKSGSVAPVAYLPELEEPSAFSQAVKNRIPMVQFLSELNETLPLLGNNDAILHVAHWLEQAGHDGTIKFWGKRKPHGLPTVAKTGVLSDIPPEHWMHFKLDWGLAFKISAGNLLEVNDDNYRVSTYTSVVSLKHQDIFMDVHLDKAQAKKLLIENPIVVIEQKPEYISLEAAARDFYSEARLHKSIWADAADRLGAPEMTGAASEEEILDYIGTYIIGKIAFGGVKPPSIHGEFIQNKHGSVQRGATEYRGSDGQIYKDLNVRVADLQILINEMKESGLKTDSNI